MNDQRPAVLIVDDEEANLQKLKRTFVGDFAVLEARSGEEALEVLQDEAVSAIITDQRMPGISGVELLQRSREVQPEAARIVLTGYTEVEDLMDAINEGRVHRYITKPWDPFSLRQCVQQQLAQSELERENQRLAEQLKQANSLLKKENRRLREEVDSLKEDDSKLVYRSRAMEGLLGLVDRVVQTESTVLIQGETGTGKELLARYIQRRSPRAEHPFVPVNCGAVPHDLVESAFFGHRKGSFTGAVDDARGFFELAHRGILFLDEIGEASLDLQVKLLRVLQDGEIQAVGAEQRRKIDVRIIASTNRSLSEMVEKGTFRQDLYFRLNVFSILVPPLRARRDDIEALARHFLEKFSRRDRKFVAEFDERTLQAMRDYDWPGNVRELENEVERLVILCEPGAPIPPQLLSERVQRGARRQNRSGSLKEQLADLERQLILEALDACDDNRSQAAQTLGITRQTIISKLKQYQDR